MLHHKSKPDDILHYIEQMKMLVLSEKEKEQLNQIMNLNTLINDASIKNLIIEDLKDDKWLKDTDILIDACAKKLQKSLSVQQHIEECKNFIVYRFLEEKTFLTDLEISKQMGAWHFNEVDKHGEKAKWVSQRFMRAFETSEIYSKFEQMLKETNTLSINLKWLYTNRKIFFGESIFDSLNIKKKQKKESLFENIF